jgi:hypothetical protein
MNSSSKIICFSSSSKISFKCFLLMLHIMMS